MRLPAAEKLVIYQHAVTFKVLTLRVAKGLLFMSSCQMGHLRSSHFAMVAVITYGHRQQCLTFHHLLLEC